MAAAPVSPIFPDYLLDLQFAQNWISLIAHIITIATMGTLLWATHYGLKIVRIKGLSPGLRLFFLANIAFATFGLPYQIYRIAFWTSGGAATPANNMGNRYNFDLLFWLSMPEFVYYGAIPATVLLLTIERSLTLKFPFAWPTKHFATIGPLCFAAIVAYNLIGHLVELPLNYSLAPICQAASCTTSDSRLYFQISSKIAFSCADVIISIIFLFLLREAGAAKKLNNRVILFTLVIEFCMGVVPTFLMVVFNKFTSVVIGGVSNGGEKGELLVMICALDAATCGLLYWTLLFRWNRPSSSASVGSVLHHSAPIAIVHSRQLSAQKNNEMEMVIVHHHRHRQIHPEQRLQTHDNHRVKFK